MPKEIKEKIISQISALFNSHILTEDKIARDIFLTYLNDYLDQEKQKWAEEIKLEKREIPFGNAIGELKTLGYNQAVEDLETLLQRLKNK